MKRVALFISVFLLIIIIVIFGLYYFLIKTRNFGPIGPGLPGECFMIFKPEKDNDYSNLVLGILNKKTYNPSSRKTEEVIYPYFEIKKADNGYYYGWVSICLFGANSLSRNERFVILKNNLGNYYSVIKSHQTKAATEGDIVYDNFKFSEFYYCSCGGKCAEGQIIKMTSDKNFIGNCSRNI